MSKVFKSQFGRKFLIPAEYDILIDFAPIAYSKINFDAGYQPQHEGKFRFRAKHVSEITKENRVDEYMQVVDRLPSLNPPDETPQEEIIVVPVEDGEQSVELLDDYALTQKDQKNWDGETVADNGSWSAWRGDEAFVIGGISVSNEEAAAGIGATVIVIIILVVICCIVSFLERKKIAEEARRASTTIRASVRRMTGADPDKDDGTAQAPKTEKEIKEMAKSNASNKNERQFLGDMFTEQYKED